MAERALVDFRRGVMVSLDNAEDETAFFAVAQSRASAFLGLAERDVLAMAERAFKHFGFGVDILIDQSHLEAASLPSTSAEHFGFPYRPPEMLSPR